MEALPPVEGISALEPLSEPAVVRTAPFIKTQSAPWTMHIDAGPVSGEDSLDASTASSLGPVGKVLSVSKEEQHLSYRTERIMARERCKAELACGDAMGSTEMARRAPIDSGSRPLATLQVPLRDLIAEV
jgi:hypothetical protein